MVFEEADLVIRNCIILPMTQLGIINKGLISIKDGNISYVGRIRDAPKTKAETVIEGHGKLAMPGLVNCHTHLAMTLFRGLAENVKIDEWLRRIIWPLEAKLKPQDVYFGALLGCLEMIKNGITCFADMYFFESKTAEAVEKAGLRAVLASGIVDVNSVENMATYKEAVAFARHFQGQADGRITTSLGPHSVSTCSEESLRKIREKASEHGFGIQIHLSESEGIDEEIERTLGLSETEFLEKLNFLSDDVLAAHCIHLSPGDMKILAKRMVRVAYNPIANLKLASGIAKVKDLLDLDISVGLGTDGAASNNSLDIFESMKMASLIQKLKYQDPSVLPAHTVLKLATIHGAEALGLERKIGSLEAGKKADIILVDLKRANLIPLHDLCANLVYSAHGSDVDTTIVNGKVIMANQTVKTVNEDEVLSKAAKAARELLDR
ncbi:MAG: amidohydrolase [Candidatus Bathyarchaeota archaeon]|nr:amidohydrolase [Candidatus Bathyarchaeota archaeon]